MTSLTSMFISRVRSPLGPMRGVMPRMVPVSISRRSARRKVPTSEVIWNHSSVVTRISASRPSWAITWGLAMIVPSWLAVIK
jgi:hypothetical protein